MKRLFYTIILSLFVLPLHTVASDASSADAPGGVSEIENLFETIKTKELVDVLMLVPGTSTMGWSDTLTKDFLTEFTGNGQLASSMVHVVHHDQNFTEASENLYRDKLALQFKYYDFKLIISHFDYAENIVDFLRTNGHVNTRVLFFNAPEDYTPSDYAPIRTSAIIRERDTIKILELARELIESDTIFFIIGFDDKRVIENFVRSQLEHDKRFAYKKMFFIQDNEYTPSEAARLISSTKSPSYVIKLSPWRDKNTGLIMPSEELISMIDSASYGRHLILANSSYGMSSGLAGGYFLDTVTYASQISSLAKRIIESGDNINTVTKSQPYLAVSILNRFGINVDDIPPGIATKSYNNNTESPSFSVLLVLVPTILGLILLMAVFETMRRKSRAMDIKLLKQFIEAIPIPFVVFDEIGRIIHRSQGDENNFLRDTDNCIEEIPVICEVSKNDPTIIQRFMNSAEEDGKICTVNNGSMRIKTIPLRRDIFSKKQSAIMFFMPSSGTALQLGKTISNLEKSMRKIEVLKALLEYVPCCAAIKEPYKDFKPLFCNRRYNEFFHQLPQTSFQLAEDPHTELLKNEFELLYSGEERHFTASLEQFDKPDRELYVSLRLITLNDGSEVIIETAVEKDSAS